MNKDEKIEMLLSSRDKHADAYKGLHNLCCEAGQLLRKISQGWEGQDKALSEEYADKICEMESRLRFERPE